MWNIFLNILLGTYFLGNMNWHFLVFGNSILKEFYLAIHLVPKSVIPFLLVFHLQLLWHVLWHLMCAFPLAFQLAISFTIFSCILAGTAKYYRRKFRSQTSDNMDRWKAEQGRGREKRQIRRKKSRRERVRRKKMQMREKVGKSRNTAFFEWFRAPEGRKVGSLKQRVRSQLARWEMKNCTPLWREAHLQVKMYKTFSRPVFFLAVASSSSWSPELHHTRIRPLQKAKRQMAAQTYWLRLRCANMFCNIFMHSFCHV